MDQIEKILLLPNPEFFQSNVKGEPPLIKFYSWILQEAHPMLSVLAKDQEINEFLRYINCSKIVIHEDYDLKLRKITKKFIIKKYRLPAKMAEKEIMWHFLDIGPSTKDLENKDKNHVYLLEGYLKKEQYEQR